MHTLPPLEIEANQLDAALAERTAVSRVRIVGLDLGSVLVSAFAISVAAAVFAVLSDRFQHWFLIPISLCGVLVGIDAVDWLRGRFDLYDPAGIVGVFGVHYFFFAPLLHVQWDTWLDLPAPPDWRDWLGYMGAINALGIILYHLARRIPNANGRPQRVSWRIDRTKFAIVLPLFILVSAVAQTLVYARFGGITGYMDSRMNDPASFEGMGWLFMISESAPLLLVFFLVVHLQQRKISWTAAVLALLAVFAVQMYFGGLRGSRSETVQLLFWAVGCIHLVVRPVPRKLIYPGVAFLIAFLYFYGFYKAMGMDATAVFTASPEERTYLAEQKQKTFRGLVLWDLSRADLQAYILFKLVNDGKDFDYAKGRTYLGALAILIPRSILSNRPYSKLKEGTEIQSGSGYDPEYDSSHVYGMPGEAMLNFGPLAVPFAYAAFGWFVGWFQRTKATLSRYDVRLLFVSFGVYMCLSMLLGDSDNIIFGLAKNGFVPFLAIALCSTRFTTRTPYTPST